MISLETKKVELRLKKRDGGEIRDYRLFWQQEDKIISVVIDIGKIIQTLWTNQNRQGSISHHKVNLSGEVEASELTWSLIREELVCPPGGRPG